MDYVQIGTSLVSGGLAGALVNWYVNLRKQQTDVTLKLIDTFFSMYAELAGAKLLLQSPTSLNDPVQQNRVRKVGDWFEVVAALHKAKYVDRRFLQRIGIKAEIVEFRRLVENTPALKDVLRLWPHLQKFQ